MFPRWIAAATFFAGSLLAADAGLLKLAMPDAKLMAGFNITQAKLSPLGQYLLAQLPQQDPGLMQMMETTGFDPRRDLQEILMTSNAETGDSGVVLVRGGFDVPRISDACRLQGAVLGHYKGVPTMGSKNGHDLLAFPDSTLAIVGDRASVQAAIDRVSEPVAIGAELATLVQQLSTSEDIWFVSMVSPARFPLGPPAVSNLLAKAQQASGGVKFGAMVEVNLQTVAKTDKEAGELAAAFKFLLGMLQGNKLLQGLQVSAEGNLTKLSLSVPEDKVEALMAPRKE